MTINPNLPGQLHQFRNPIAGVESGIDAFNLLIQGNNERSSSSRMVAGYGGGRDKNSLLEALARPLLSKVVSELLRGNSARASQGQIWGEIATSIARASRRYW